MATIGHNTFSYMKKMKKQNSIDVTKQKNVSKKGKPSFVIRGKKFSLGMILLQFKDLILFLKIQFFFRI